MSRGDGEGGGAGGGVGERRGWLCSRRVTEAEAREKRGVRTSYGEDERESPEREWNQYVEASVCLWPHMRVSVPGEAKHASIYGGGKGSERRRVSRTLLWSNPRGQASMPPSDV